MTYAVNHTLTDVIETAEPERPILAIRHAETDAALLALWLGQHASPYPRRNYVRHGRSFLRHVERPLAEVRLGDLRPISPLSTARRRTVEVVRSGSLTRHDEPTRLP